MKKVVILLFLSFLFVETLFAASSQSQSPSIMADTLPSSEAVISRPFIYIVAPSENAHLPALSSTFVCGSAPAGGKLWINGTLVSINPGGGFLTMVNLSPGKFEIKAELQVNDEFYHFTRTIFVAGPEQPSPVSPLTIESVTPHPDQEVLPGDLVAVSCKGSPGMKAYFMIKRVKKRFPMTESPSGGIYTGVYPVGNQDRLKGSKITVTLINNKGEKISKETDGVLSLFPSDLPVMAEIASSDTVLRTGPKLASNDKAGYLMFPPAGTLLQLTGRIGDEYRVRLTKTKTVWVSADQVKLLPAGTKPAHVVVGNISVEALDHSTSIRIPLGRKIPFKIDPDIEGNQIDIALFGAFSNTDMIVNPAAGVVKNVSWSQDEQETYRLHIITVSHGWWGYDARYEGNNLVLELRTPPPLVPGASPLADLTIALDPGHGGTETGAIGATGYLEKDANLAQVLNLKEKLLAKGAKVFLTRQEDVVVSLSERPRIAWQNQADILISLHNNSLQDGGNPFIKHGYGVYYFTPMSLALAKEIHAAYGAAFGEKSEFQLADDGMYYDNLAVTRAPQMPSILIESLYMIVPEEEAYLKTDSFRSVSSNAIINGLERYVRSMHSVESDG